MRGGEDGGATSAWGIGSSGRTTSEPNAAFPDAERLWNS